jgi:endoglucanase
MFVGMDGNTTGENHVKVRNVSVIAAALLSLTVAYAGTAKNSKTAMPTSTREFVGIDAHVQVAQMGRGINVLSEDPGWTNPANARFKPEHFKKIRDAGFSTVRIVLNSFDRMDQYYGIESGWLQHLDMMVNAALGAGLTVVLDEHDNYLPCGKDAVVCGQKLNAFWAQIAPRYKDKSNRLVFEILNEPNSALTPDVWNAQIKQTLPIIRASNPVRNVVIGPAMAYAPGLLGKLDLPASDRHIITTVHYYEPMEFTHQGAPWAHEVKLTGRTWGSEADIMQLNKDFDVVKAWSIDWNRPIWLGEFGAYETAPMDGRQRYDSAVARAAEARGFAWCYWQFDKDFVVFDIAKDAWVDQILDALVPIDRSKK